MLAGGAHRPRSSPKLLVACAAGLIIGSGITALAYRSRALDSAPRAMEQGAGRSAPGAGSGGGRLNQEELAAAMRALVVAAANAPAAPVAEMDEQTAIGRLFASARTDASLRKELLDRFKREPPGEIKEALLNLLSSLQRPDVLAFSLDLAASEARGQRLDGLRLLAGLGMKVPEARQRALHALEGENDPALIGAAVSAFQPAATGPAEDALAVGQLGRLAGHADSAVRAQAIRALAGWDKTGGSIPSVERALADSSPEVRWAAVAAVSENHLRSDALKGRLLGMVASGNEPPDVRLSAAHALERFALDEDESLTVARSAKEADAKLYASESM